MNESEVRIALGQPQPNRIRHRNKKHTASRSRFKHGSETDVVVCDSTRNPLVPDIHIRGVVEDVDVHKGLAELGSWCVGLSLSLDLSLDPGHVQSADRGQGFLVCLVGGIEEVD